MILRRFRRFVSSTMCPVSKIQIRQRRTKSNANICTDRNKKDTLQVNDVVSMLLF